jgi:protoporphyrinogen oxidase
MKRETAILGAGVTGLAAGWSSGLPIYEAVDAPGGICSSYYVRPGSKERLHAPPSDGEAYRFEIGGGHWIFGGDPLVLDFFRRLVPLRRYERRSSVFFPDEARYVPYPLQNHLHALDAKCAAAALDEMTRAVATPVATMREWLAASFGPTLCERFFFPFHDLYTAGLYREIAPQDAYKSPVDLATVRRGAAGPPPAVGYNVTFLYPEPGLDAFARALAARAPAHYGKCVAKIDADRRELFFADGTALAYERLLSTLPLSRAVELAGVAVAARPDPSTAVLVLNVGARRGARSTDNQWLYVPASRAGFHRVGFYDAVDRSFLPASSRAAGDRVSIYVERALRAPLEGRALAAYCDDVVRELQDWQLIGDAEVVDPTWIDVAYTWSWPGSRWRDEAVAALAAVGIDSIGRYGRWTFQGIADSVREGLAAGAAYRS